MHLIYHDINSIKIFVPQCKLSVDTIFAPFPCTIHNLDMNNNTIQYKIVESL